MVLLACAVIGVILVGMIQRAFSRLDAAERRIALLETELQAFRQSPRGATAAPSEPMPEPLAPDAPDAPVEETAGRPPPLPIPDAPRPSPPPLPPTAVPPALPAAAPSLEERLGTRWAVWVGGFALAVGALLLVRYSFEHGWVGPGVRVLAGLVLAVALVGAGETMRRRDRDAQRIAPQIASIPAVLTAAGTVAAFGSIYAAHALYGFIGPDTAFVALAICALVCMLAAALHGPALAAVGLLGALAAPLLVDSAEPNPWTIPVYVGFVVASALVLARLHRWLWLAVSAAVGGALWTLLLVSSGGPRDPALCQAALQQIVVTLAFAWRASARDAPETSRLDRVGTGVPVGVMLVALFVLGDAATERLLDVAWVLTAIVAVGLPALAGLIAPQRAGLVLASGVAVIVVLGIWPTVPPTTFESISIFQLWRMPENAAGFVIFGTLGALLPAVAAGRRVWLARPAEPVLAALYAGAMTLTPLAILAAFYLRFSDGGADMTLAAIAGGLALGFVVAAQAFRAKVDTGAPTATLGLGTTAAATLAALSLGLVFALDHGLLTVALALAALGAAFVDRRLAIPALRWCVAGLALVIAARLAWEPRIVGVALSRTPIFNWLLWGYGVPALAFALAARFLRTRADDIPARAAEAAAILFSALLAFFEIRHALNGGDPYAPRSGLTEQALFATAALAYAIGLTRLEAHRRSPVLRVATFLFSGLSALIAVLALLLVDNPLFDRHIIPGGAWFNTLLIAYALPAILAALLARVAEGVRPSAYVTTARVLACVFGFVYLNLELRRVFVGPDLRLFALGFRLRMSDAEWYAYSALWLATGITLLGFGLWRGSAWLRTASAILLVATVLKVFLLDLASLEGILRSLSFIGLGAVLIGIGLVYQRLIFTRRPAAPPAPD